MRNNTEIRYFSIFEAQSSLRQEKRLSGDMQQYQRFYAQHVFFIFLFFFIFYFFFFFFGISEICQRELFAYYFAC